MSGKFDEQLNTVKGVTSSRTSLLVPKKKVPANLHLADRSSLHGDLYIDCRRGDGSPGRVIDRLNDFQERFMPLAVEDRHLLVNKSLIVRVDLSRRHQELGASTLPNTRKAQITCELSTGECLEGNACTSEDGQIRMLDYLNHTIHRFIGIETGSGVTLINVHYLVGVYEVIAFE